MALSTNPPFRSCLLIGTPTLKAPFSASDSGVNSFYDFNNINMGHRVNRFYSAVNSGTYEFRWSFPLGKKVDYFHFARIDISDLARVILEGSNNNISYTNIITVNSPFTLQGSNRNDLLVTFPTSPTYLYFRLRLVINLVPTLGFSKFNFGELFDIGANPRADLIEKREIKSRGLFRSTSNIVSSSRLVENLYSYKIEHHNVTDSKVLEFQNLFFNKKNRYVVLYNDTDLNFFNGDVFLHGIISGIKIKKRSKNSNIVKYEVDQMEG